MANVLDRTVRAQGGGVVKPHQVKAMILAARRAYLVQAKAGLVDDGVDFDDWRRAALHDVVGAAAPSSFRAVTQGDYAAVIDYFGELAGGEASPTRSVKDEDAWRRAIWSLTLAEGEVAKAFGGADGARRYADALFSRVHKTDRIGATARQVWAVIFTLRGRAAKRRAKSALESLGASDAPSSPPARPERFPAFSRAL